MRASFIVTEFRSFRSDGDINSKVGHHDSFGGRDERHVVRVGVSADSRDDHILDRLADELDTRATTSEDRAQLRRDPRRNRSYRRRPIRQHRRHHRRFQQGSLQRCELMISVPKEFPLTSSPIDEPRRLAPLFYSYCHFATGDSRLGCVLLMC